MAVRLAQSLYRTAAEYKSGYSHECLAHVNTASMDHVKASYTKAGSGHVYGPADPLELAESMRGAEVLNVTDCTSKVIRHPCIRCGDVSCKVKRVMVSTSSGEPRPIYAS